MTSTQEQLIAILANEFFAVGAPTPTIKDYDSVLTEASQQAVFPLAYQTLRSSILSTQSIPAEKKSQYAKEYAANQASYIRNLHYHAELHKLLTGIPYVILKGQVSASYYPNPMFRSMGDVDFLIQKEDREKVDRILKDEGFIKRNGAEKHDYHWAYRMDRTSLELHWDVPGLPESMVNRYTEDVIKNARETQVVNNVMMFPSPFHHGLVLLLHTISHMTGGGIGLRHLCDWIVFEESIPEPEFLVLFENPLKDIGLWNFAKMMTKIGVLFFGSDRKWCLDAEDEVCRALLEDILSGGNFGTKDNTRGSQAKLIQNRVTKSVQESVLKNVLVSIDEKAKRDYLFCEESVILRPVGWAAVAGQYAVRDISGKRNNIFDKKIMTDAMNRQKLYAELKLFESMSIKPR